MSDDWRLRFVLDDHGLARELAESLGSGDVEHELDKGFHERVIVSVEEAEVFAYADSQEQAAHARDAIDAVCRTKGWHIVEEQLQRWHPVAEQWEDPDAPLPDAPDQVAAERSELLAEEREESTAEGYPGWEVRIEFGSHHETREFGATLDEQGLAHVRRWKYILLGAIDEQSAQQLADRMRAACPPGAVVTVEATLPAIAAGLPPNPFAIFGGLGG